MLGAALFSVLSLITNVLGAALDFFQAQPVNLALYFNAATFLFGAIVVVLHQRDQRPPPATAAEDSRQPACS